jgi:sugar phosphate isomerase/epimerase
MIYTRRDLGKIALAALPAIAFAKVNSKVNGVRLGAQTYSFRASTSEGGGDPIDKVIKAMTDIGLGECELFGSQAEASLGAPMPRVQPRPPSGERKAGPPPDTAARKKARDDLRQWRLSTPLEGFKGIRKKFDDAGILLFAYNYSFRDDFTDEEIERGFEMANALGVKVITASSTISTAKRVAPFADKHKITVAMHGHSNTKDPNEFSTPESFAQAMALSKHFAVNLDIGHFAASGYDPMEYIEAHHDRITNLHLKDRKKNDGPNTPWGEGDTPIKQVLLLLKNKKYPIPAYIEYEYHGTGSPEEEVKKCFQFCKDALA